MYRVKKLLNDLVEYTYPNSPKLKAYKAFYIEYVNEDKKSKHGEYNQKNKRIRIFNLYRTEDQLVVTSIHELAHHITLIDNDSCRVKPHGQEFYNTYKKLLYKALDMGLFKRWQFEKATADASDSRKVKAMLDEYVPHPVEYKKDVCLIQVPNGYEHREKLKTHGYKFNATNKCWELETESLDKEKKALDEDRIEYKVVNAKSINIS